MRNKRKIFYWTLLISWMIFIAIMSHKPANISDSYSMAIIFGIDKLGLPLNLVFGDLSNFIIRKSAQCSEFIFKQKKINIDNGDFCVFICLF